LLPDPKPFLLVLLLHGAGILILAGWWCLQPDPERWLRLLAIAQVEHISALPPQPLWEQPGWLINHRLKQAQGWGGLACFLVIALAGEALAYRQTDTLAGFRFSCFTIGVILLAMVLGGFGWYCVIPWSVPTLWAGLGLTSLLGTCSFFLLCGRPYVA